MTGRTPRTERNTDTGEARIPHLQYKVLVVGDIGTGKTSFIRRYTNGTFNHDYRSTIGVDFGFRDLFVDSDVLVRLQLWDIAGERASSMTRVYYKEAVGAFIMFDVTRMGTLDTVMEWKKDLDEKVFLLPNSCSSSGAGDRVTPIPVILIANKIDLVATSQHGWGKTKEEMDTFCQTNGFTGWFETSAKDNISVDQATEALIEQIGVMMRLQTTLPEDRPRSFKIASSRKGKRQDQYDESTECGCSIC